MRTEYSQWIQIWYPTQETAIAQCAKATEAMVQVFPELRRVRGHVSVGGFEREHWWCLSPDNEIVDPTAHQWPALPLEYVEYDGPEPIGKCVECGEYIYEGNSTVHEQCERAFMRSLFN
jgi:hypothetical protein